MYSTVLSQGYFSLQMMNEIIKHKNELEGCIWIKDINGKYLHLNKDTCSLLGNTEKNLINKNGYTIFESESRDLIKDNDIEVITKQKRSTINEKLFINGKEFVVHVNKFPIINNDGSCSSLLALGCIAENEISYNSYLKNENTNLTQLIVLENQKNRRNFEVSKLKKYIRELYEKYNLYGISILSYDIERKMLTEEVCYNRCRKIRFKNNIKLLDYEKELFIDEHIDEKYVLDKSVYKDLGNKFYTFKECSCKLKDCTEYMIPIVYESHLLGVIEFSASLDILNFIDEDKENLSSMLAKITLIMKVIKLSEELVTQVRQKNEIQNDLGLFLNISSDLYMILNRYGHILEISSSVEKVLGWKMEELKHCSIESIILEMNNSVSIEEILENYNEKRFGGVWKLSCKDNREVLFQWTYYNDKTNSQIYISGKNITASSNIVDKFTTFEKKIELDLFKSNFLSNVSHEFKTPLNLILSTAQLQLVKLKNSTLSLDDNNKYTKTIEQNALRLLKLVNNLIDVNELENTKDIIKENMDIVSFVENIITSISKYVKSLNRNIIFDTNEEVLFLAFNAEKIERVILNLISNSIKYTKAGGTITVTVTKNSKKKRVYIAVKDDGIGIKNNEANSIFERFKRLDDTFIRNAEGIGIGLPLSKILIEQHSGEIYLNTKVIKGTEITFYIPIKTVSNKASLNSDSFKNKVVQIKNELISMEFSDIY